MLLSIKNMLLSSKSMLLSIKNRTLQLIMNLLMKLHLKECQIYFWYIVLLFHAKSNTSIHDAKEPVFQEKCTDCL